MDVTDIFKLVQGVAQTKKVAVNQNEKL